MQIKPNLVNVVINIVFMRSIYSLFEGVVVARLPFEPLSFLTSMTHYGLPGEDMRDCSIIAIYIMMVQTLRIYIVKLMGLQGEGARIAAQQKTPWTQ